VEVTASGKVPYDPGVPARRPLPVRVSPTGSTPELTTNWYGPLPPEARRETLYGVPDEPPGSDDGEIPITGQFTTRV
jgi:hypothetical protein